MKYRETITQEIQFVDNDDRDAYIEDKFPNRQPDEFTPGFFIVPTDSDNTRSTLSVLWNRIRLVSTTTVGSPR